MIQDTLIIAQSIEIDEAMQPSWITIFFIFSVVLMIYSVVNLYFGRFRGRQKVQKPDVASLALRKTQPIAHVGNWSYDMTNHSMFISDEVRHILGLSETLIRPTLLSIKRLIHFEDRKSIEDIITRVTLASLEFDLSHRVKLDNGDIKWLQHNVKSAVDKCGNFTFEGTLSDITRSRESEKRRLGDGRFFRGLTKKTERLIALLDESKREFHGDPVLEHAINYTDDDKVEMREFSKVHPADREVADRWMLESNALPGKAITLTFLSEKKKADDAIRKSELQLADAQRLAQCGSWSLDLSENSLSWSRDLYDIFDVEQDAFAEMPNSFFHLVVENDRDMVYQTRSKCQKDGEPFDIEYQIVISSGETRIIHELGYPERNEDGRVVRLFGTAQNVTSARAFEFTSRENEKKYRYLFYNNPLPMAIWHLETMEIIECNEVILAKYGYSRTEFLQLTIKDLRPEDERGAIDDSLGVTTTERKIIKKVLRHKKKNGDVMFVEITRHLIDYMDRTCVFEVINDVTEKLSVEKGIRSSNQRLRELTAHLQTIREQERTRIAREIHDELGQQLTGLKIDASWIRNRVDAKESPIHNKLQRMISLIDDTVKTVQRIASDLRPGILDDLGLIPAIEWQGQEFERRTGITTVCRMETFDAVLGKDLATCIFRVYQEALTNVARHSHATKVETVLLSANGFIELNIEDNGIGFDTEESGTKKSWGLVGMKERALMFNGELLISSIPKLGTRLSLKVPLTTNQPS